MRVFRLILLTGIMFSLTGFSQSAYQRYFTDNALRIDYFHYGSKHEDHATIDQLYEVSPWAGSRRHLLDSLNRGDYMVRVYDSQSNNLIFSRGFSTLFREWQTTEEANAGAQKTIHETILIPFPRQEVRIEFLKRDSLNIMNTMFFETTIDPDSWKINREKRSVGVEVTPLVRSGAPENKVDLALLAEGYTRQEKEKFLSDARRLMEHLFTIAPFTKYRNRFNVNALFKPSAESGVDDPAHGVFRNTVLNASFNTFGSQRYLMTFDSKSLHDMASAAPYDALYILVNDSQYGGGAIYNLYAATTVDDQWSPFVFVHEFGHSFAGLGDEYYTSQVAYTDFHNEGVEPWEPNVTAHPKRSELKWKKFVQPDTPLPTPWQQEEYDRMSAEWYKSRKELLKQGTSDAEIHQAEMKHINRLLKFFASLPFGNRVGAFEGAGYQGKGLFRPMVNCIMFSKGATGFDPVCRDAFERVIRYWTE